jgi:hypothetical protein
MLEARETLLNNDFEILGDLETAAMLDMQANPLGV